MQKNKLMSYSTFQERFQKKKQKSKKIGEFIVIDYVEKPRHNNVKSKTIIATSMK